jgi:adenine-specific DNA methylase
MAVGESPERGVPLRLVGPGDYRARGAFFTPPQVTAFLVRWAIRAASDRVLEPTCGEAAFLTPIVETLRAHGAADEAVGRQLFGFDIEPESVAAADQALRELGVMASLRVANFFEVPTPGELGAETPWVDAVVGNPPFIRYQRFTGRDRLLAQQAALRAQVRVQLSGLASSWAASLVHASEFLTPDGRLAMVLPAELLTVNYAEPIRRFLHRRFATVDLVMFEDLVFDAALENVVLLLAEGSGGCDHFRLHHVADEDDLADTFKDPQRVEADALGGKWTSQLFLPPPVRALHGRLTESHFRPLGSYGQPRLGLVTGANRFFALRPSTVRNLDLANDDLARISPPGTRHLRGLAFTERDWHELADADEPVYLLRLAGVVGPDHPAAPLIAEGLAAGVADAYKCRIRTPWYVVPPVEVPDLFFTYMSHHFPRLIDNRAKVGFVNSMHGLQLQAHKALARAALPLASFNSLTLLGAEIEGRSYGGGVLKMEPREAARLPVPGPEILAEIWRRLRPRKAALDSQLRRIGWPRVVAEVDEIVLRDVLALSHDEVHHLQEAAADLRARRLRRGKSG